MTELPDVPRGYAVCPRCEQRMEPGVSCDDSHWSQGGQWICPTRYGAEIPEPAGDICRDCNAPRGGTHHYDCAVEQCPHGRQAITCDRCEPIEGDPYHSRTN
jgi:hypothetical protein